MLATVYANVLLAVTVARSPLVSILVALIVMGIDEPEAPPLLSRLDILEF